MTESPVSSLPLDKATVNVNVRVVDDVKDERQNISVVSGVPMSVPVVDAKPTERPGVFTAAISGPPFPPISVDHRPPAVPPLRPGVPPPPDTEVRPAGVTPRGKPGAADVRFPPPSRLLYPSPSAAEEDSEYPGGSRRTTKLS
ncbi:colicin-like bacteriocin tRNase domain-containing protein [Salmonella enterica]|uniref:colicin-like bacteriocin tRNase domain-containing protein n=1 Tax=Salmonella enterica TaxID=28901 RepID=UPI00352F44AE